MYYSKTPQKHITNQKPKKVIGKLSKLVSKNARFILFDFGRNNFNSMQRLLLAPLLVSNWVLFEHLSRISSPSSFFAQSYSVLLQPWGINFFHSSLAASFFNSSLFVMTGGSLPHVEVTFPESMNIYLINWFLLFVFSINLLCLIYLN